MARELLHAVIAISVVACASCAKNDEAVVTPRSGAPQLNEPISGAAAGDVRPDSVAFLAPQAGYRDLRWGSTSEQVRAWASWAEQIEEVDNDNIAMRRFIPFVIQYRALMTGNVTIRLYPWFVEDSLFAVSKAYDLGLKGADVPAIYLVLYEIIEKDLSTEFGMPDSTVKPRTIESKVVLAAAMCRGEAEWRTTWQFDETTLKLRLYCPFPTIGVSLSIDEYWEKRPNN